MLASSLRAGIFLLLCACATALRGLQSLPTPLPKENISTSLPWGQNHTDAKNATSGRSVEEGLSVTGGWRQHGELALRPKGGRKPRRRLAQNMTAVKQQPPSPKGKLPQPAARAPPPHKQQQPPSPGKHSPPPRKGGSPPPRKGAPPPHKATSPPPLQRPGPPPMQVHAASPSPPHVGGGMHAPPPLTVGGPAPRIS